MCVCDILKFFNCREILNLQEKLRGGFWNFKMFDADCICHLLHSFSEVCQLSVKNETIQLMLDVLL
jgi:hypothetical protein